MAQQEKQLLTIVEITDGGQMKFNGGKATGMRKFIKTAQGLVGQAWVKSDRSLAANYPLHEMRYYDVSPLNYQGKQTYKIAARRADDLTDQDKDERRKAIASQRLSTPSATEAQNIQSNNQSVHNTIISALAVLGATVLVVNGKENIAEIVPRAMILKEHMKTVCDIAPVSPPNSTISEVTDLR